MDGTGEGATAAPKTVPELEAELDAARQAERDEDAAEGSPAAAAPGDGKTAAEGVDAPTAAGTGAIVPPNPTGAGAAVPADAGAAGEQPTVLELLQDTQQASKDAGGGVTSPHSFIEDLRSVSARLVADGRIVEADLVTAAEAPAVQATLIKLVGDVLAKVRS